MLENGERLIRILLIFYSELNKINKSIVSHRGFASVIKMPNVIFETYRVNLTPIGEKQRSGPRWQNFHLSAF